MTKFLTFDFNDDRPDVCNMGELDEKFPESEIVATNWCYLYHIVEVNKIPDNMRVSDFLRALIEFDEEGGPAPLFQFSVTSREPRFQEFLDAVSGVPGHSIVPVQRRYGGSEYTAYLCTFPTAPTFDNI